MTRLDMQQRIGAGPYAVITDTDGLDSRDHYCELRDGHGAVIVSLRGQRVPTDCSRRHWVTEYDTGTMERLCELLNELWESAK